ncbi:CAP domain-containing protein [bacterium]|nr:CAP domain-containing protein [bacterium]
MRKLLSICLALALLCLCCACSGGSRGEPPIPGWPPTSPRQPGRLALADPAEMDPYAWWRKNILSLVPTGTYQNEYYRERSAQIVRATNERRAAYGLAPLQELSGLNRVAQAHAMDQAIRDYWSHLNPEALSSRQRIEAAGVGTVSAGGENSAISFYNYSDGAGIVYGFEHHTGHRELLLSPDVKYIGVGIYDYGPGENEFVVQLLVDFANAPQS